MELGTFSVSLAVKDINKSIDFYGILGFKVIFDHRDQNWAILQNDKAIIGLFQGMFEENIMTFNPKDVRGIQAQLLKAGVELNVKADPDTTGPAHISFTDPDGNAILIDQHE